MEALFLKLFNMSVTASWIVLAVIILRPLLKKAPKAVTVFLWGLVGIRLIFPISFESVLSLIPSGEILPSDILTTKTPAIDSGISYFNQAVNPVINNSLAPVVGDSVNPMQVVAFIAAVIWIIGIAAMLIYAVISYIRIYRKVREGVRQEGNIYICDRISAPFILGVFRPKIYLPSAIDRQDAEYVIAHERAHLKRRDHLIKPFGFLLLTVYWFNPVIWIAYILLCRDIELACDERVIKQLGEQAKKPYSSALINCSMPRRSVAACPLAFGEVGVKSRIKSVLNYKKPAFWIIAAALALCVILPVAFLTNPISATLDNIINEKNYIIASQEKYNVILTVPKSVINESAYTEKGQKFKKNEAPVFETNTTTVYLKKIMLSNSSNNELFLIFDCSYGSIDKNNSVLIPYTKIKNGTNSCVGLNSGDIAKENVSVWSSGPDEQFGFSVAKETLKNSPEDIKIYAFLNKLTYAKKGEVSPDSFGISGSVISAECDDIEYEYLSGSIRGDFPHISVRWTNKTDDVLCFGDEFTLYKDGKICEREENTGFNLLLHVVDSGESEEEVYNLSAYNLESGNYRLEKQFYLKSNPDKKYRAFIDFSVDKTYSFLGKNYQGEKIVYENGLYSFVLSDNDIPQFFISDEDFSLSTTDYPESAFTSSWYKIGGLQKIELKSSNFDDLFEAAVWKHGYSAKSLRKNNLNAFSAFDLSGRMYYLLEQINGDIFIAMGYTETNSFRWIFKMREAD
ncbi:MAG: M56 family metallopeptidase [Acutalibacteraceae bacterium]